LHGSRRSDVATAAARAVAGHGTTCAATGEAARTTHWTPDDMARGATLKQQGDRQSKIMVTSYVVGGAAIAAGAILLVTSGGNSESGVAIVPAAGGAFISFTARK
jgi:hypothetical protein